MIQIDMRMPERCDDCPFSYWIQSGEYEGLMMCNTLEFKESGQHIIENYLVDESASERPDKCPLNEA